MSKMKLQNNVPNQFKVNKKKKTNCSVDAIVDFEQVNACWDGR